MNNKTNQILLGSFCVAFVKSLIVPPSYAAVAVIAVIAGLFAYLEYKNRDKELEKLVLAVNSHDKDLQELKDKVSSIKLVQQVKPGAMTFR